MKRTLVAVCVLLFTGFALGMLATIAWLNYQDDQALARYAERQAEERQRRDPLSPRVAPEVRPEPYRAWPLNTFVEPGHKVRDGWPIPIPHANGEPFCVRGHLGPYGHDGWWFVATGLPYDPDQWAAYMVVAPEELPDQFRDGIKRSVVVCGRYLGNGIVTANASRRLYDVQWVGRIQP